MAVMGDTGHRMSNALITLTGSADFRDWMIKEGHEEAFGAMKTLAWSSMDHEFWAPYVAYW